MASKAESKMYDLTIGEDIKRLELGLTKMQALVVVGGHIREGSGWWTYSEVIDLQQ